MVAECQETARMAHVGQMYSPGLSCCPGSHTTMTKKNKNGNGGARGRGRGRPIANQSFSVKGAHDQLPHLHGLFDPFCDGSARIPDGSGTQSVPMYLKRLYSVDTNATGKAMLGFIGGRLNNRLYTATSFTGDDVSAAAASAHPDYTDLVNDFGYYRIVSQGMVWHPTTSYDQRQGLLAIKGFGELSSFTTNPKNYASITEVQDSCSIDDHRVVQLYPRGIEARRFDAVSQQDQQWGNVAFFFEGCAASTQIGFIEEYIKLELVPDPGTLWARMATPTPHRNPAILDAMDSIRGDHGTVKIGERVSQWADSATRMINSVGRAAGSAWNLYQGAKMARAGAGVLQLTL